MNSHQTAQMLPDCSRLHIFPTASSWHAKAAEYGGRGLREVRVHKSYHDATSRSSSVRVGSWNSGVFDCNGRFGTSRGTSKTAEVRQRRERAPGGGGVT